MSPIKPAFLKLFCVCALVVGCENVNQPGEQAGLTNSLFRQPVENPGELHNKLCRAYEARRTGDPITRHEFVSNAVEAANEIFREEGFEPIATRADIEVVVNELIRLRKDGVFDIFSENPGSPVVIIDAWEKRGFLNQELAEAIRARLSSATGEIVPMVEEKPSEVLRAFDSVRVASREYWTKEASAHLDRRIANGLDPQKRRDYVYQVDAIGSVAGWLLSGGGFGGLVAGAIFSWAFMEMPPANDPGWEDPNYGAA